MICRGPFLPLAAPAALAAVLAAGAFPFQASAGEWSISPRVSGEQTFTDNANSSTDDPDADMISTATAGIGINGRGSRVRLNFNYDLSYETHWIEDDLDGYSHSLLGAGDVELIEDHLFIDTRASVSQEFLSRSGDISSSGALQSTNQSQVVNYSISPQLKWTFDNWVDSDITYRFNDVRFMETSVGSDSSLPSGSRNHSLTWDLTSGRKFNQFSWNVTADVNYSRSGGTQRSRSGSLEAGAAYNFNRYFAVTGSVGRDQFTDDQIDDDEASGVYWNAGFILTPGPRTRLQLQYGERYGTDSITGNFSYAVSPRTHIVGSYNVAIQTQQQFLGTQLNDIDLDDYDQVEVAPGLFAFQHKETGAFLYISDLFSTAYVDTTFRSEVFTLGLNGSRGRNSFSLNTNYTKRELGGSGNVDFGGGGSDAVLSVSGNFSRNLTPKASGSLNATYSQALETISGTGEDTTLTAGATYNYNFGQDLNTSVTYRYLRREGDDDTLQENVISIRLNKSF